MGDDELIRGAESWFLRRGIPHFIDDYRADEDIFTRSLPVLVLVGIVELVGAFERDWDWWGNVAAIAVGLVTVIGLWGLVNRLRGRPAWQRPRTVGNVEIAFFVIVLPFARWSAESTLRSVGLTFAFNLSLVVVVYFVTSYGLVPMARWAFGRTLDELGAVAGLFGRAMPLLLLFTIALFVNTEVWQVASSLDGLLFWTTVAFFVLVGTVFLLVRLPSEVARLGDAQDRAGVVDACAGTPMEGVVEARLGAGEVPAAAPLTKRQKGNVLLVLLFSQAIQVVLVTVTLSAFFFVFGLVAIRPEVIDAWLGDVVDPGHLAELRWLGHQLVVTRGLVHVSGFLGVLAGFYFTVYVITDSTYREEFFEEIVHQVRQSLAVRRVYLALIGLDRAEDEAG